MWAFSRMVLEASEPVVRQIPHTGHNIISVSGLPFGETSNTSGLVLEPHNPDDAGSGLGPVLWLKLWPDRKFFSLETDPSTARPSGLARPPCKDFSRFAGGAVLAETRANASLMGTVPVGAGAPREALLDLP